MEQKISDQEQHLLSFCLCYESALETLKFSHQASAGVKGWEKRPEQSDVNSARKAVLFGMFSQYCYSLQPL